MATIKDYTSSLALLLLLVSFEYAEGGEAKPTDYLPAKPSRILLPTKAGNIDIATISAKFGLFPQILSTCGKKTVNSRKQLLVPFDMAFEMSTDCSPHPHRIVVTTGVFSRSTGDPGVHIFEPILCQGIQQCVDKPKLIHVVFGKAAAKEYPALHSEAFNNNNKVDLCKAGKEAVFSNEPGCGNHPAVPKPDAISTDPIYIAPRWKTNADGLFTIIPPFTYSGVGKRKTPLLTRTNSFVKLPKTSDLTTGGNGWKPCTATCDRGNIVKMNMKPGSWKFILYLKGTAEGFKLCIDADNHDVDTATPTCKGSFEMYILPRNGIVVWPKTGRASLLEMKPRNSDDTRDYAIEIGFGYGKRIGNQLPGEFYVANMFREAVVSDSDGWDVTAASKVSFFFSSKNSLVESGGIFSPNIETGKTYVLGSDVVANEKVIDPKAGEAVAEGSESLVSPRDEPVIPMVPTTTPAPGRHASNAASGLLLSSTDNNNAAIFMPGKWWTWALYVGFLIGSLVGVAVIGGIFYIIRRTVYGFWYRGMFKRYGCDVSGTTGGITGVGFGDTTVGAVTVGGTTAGGTTAGGTTAGTTSMSTMSTTGTTGSTTKGSTIAM